MTDSDDTRKGPTGQRQLAVVVSEIDGAIVEMNTKAKHLLGTDGGIACWDALTKVPEGKRLPCEEGCVCRIIADGNEDLTAKDVMLRGESYRMSCVPVGDKVVTTLTPNKKTGPGVIKLTRREQDVLELLAEGLTSGDAAKRLGVGTSTVRTHVENMRQKLGVNTRAAIVARGYALGLIEEPE